MLCLVHRVTFSNIHKRLCEKGSFAREDHSAGRPITTRTPLLEKHVLHEIEQHPESSSRTFGTSLHGNHKLIWVKKITAILYYFFLLRYGKFLMRGHYEVL